MRDLLRAVAGPLICAAVVTGLLAAWAGTGGGGTLTRVRLQVTQAAVPMRAFTPQAAAAVPTATTFLTIKNLSGTADELVAARTPLARSVVLRQRGPAAGRPAGHPRARHPDTDPARRGPGAPAAVPVRIPRHRAAHADLPPLRHRHHRRARHRPGHAMTAAPEITTVELVIGGMTCAACAARVQAKLNKLDGVTASVNLSTERAWVSAPPAVSAPDLIAVVEAAGYTAEVAAPPGRGGRRGGRRRDGRRGRGAAAAPPADAGAGVLRPAHRRLADAVGLPVDPVPRLAVAAGGAGRAGGDLGGVAVPRRRAASGPAPVLLDGHAGVAGHPGRLRLVGVRDVRAGPRAARAERPGEPAARLRRRHLPRGGRLGDHVPAGRPALRGQGPAHRRAGHAEPGRGQRPGRLRPGRRRNRAADPGLPAPGGPAVRGPPGGADRRRRRGPVRPVRGGPQHDDRRVGPGRRGPRRRRDRRHDRADRPPGGPRRQGGQPTPSWPT